MAVTSIEHSEDFPLMSVQVVINKDGRIIKRLMILKRGKTVYVKYNDYTQFFTTSVRITCNTHTVQEALLQECGIDISQEQNWEYVVY